MTVSGVDCAVRKCCPGSIPTGCSLDRNATAFCSQQPSRRFCLRFFLLRDAVDWTGKPFAGILIDPDGQVSTFGMPYWDGFKKGLRYPDRSSQSINSLLSAAIGAQGRLGPRRCRGRCPRTAEHSRQNPHRGGQRSLDLALYSIRTGRLLVCRSRADLHRASLRRRCAHRPGCSPAQPSSANIREVHALRSALLVALFDYHTTRRVAPLFEVAFAMLPMAIVALALRLPDDIVVSDATLDGRCA